jgi:hypothetical protein
MARIIDEGRLTGRDVEILDWLADVRCATAEQISRVFFSSQGTARNRLTQLYKMRVVERAYLPPDDAIELGVSPYVLVYYPGRGGRYWLAKVRSRRFESGWKVQLPQHVAHDLVSTELVTALLEDFLRLAETTGMRVRTRLESEVVFWKLDAAGKPELRDVKRRGRMIKVRGRVINWTDPSGKFSQDAIRTSVPSDVWNILQGSRSGLYSLLRAAKDGEIVEPLWINIKSFDDG